MDDQEYANTVKELTGVLPSDWVALPNLPGVQHVEKLSRNAELVAAAVDVPRLMPCLEAEGEACVRRFVGNFGARAFRRPLTTAEVDAHVKVFRDVATTSTRDQGARAVIEAFLLSPNLALLPEMSPGTTAAGATALSSWEIASRLSYALWRSMPDAELFAAAAAGTLTRPDEVGRQLERMLRDPRATTGLAGLYAAWFSYGDVSLLAEDQEAGVDAHTGPALRAEADAFMNRVTLGGPGALDRLLLGAPQPSAALQSFYSVTDERGRARPFGGPSRVGVLGLGAVLATATDPVHRGLLVRTQLLCGAIPLPGPNIDPVLAPDGPNVTRRDRYEPQLVNATCVGCHRLMNPIGYTMERFDHLGRERTHDKGRPVDESGALLAADVEGSIEGLSELATMLRKSKDLEACVSRQWLALVQRRPVDDVDACTLGRMNEAFAGTGHDLAAMLQALVKSPTFLARPADL